MSAERGTAAHIETKANGRPPEELDDVDAARGLPVVHDGDSDVDALELAQRKLRLSDLRRVVKRAKHDAIYDLELDDGTLIPLGDISHVRDPRKVEDAIGDATDRFPPYYGPKEFRPVANALLAIAELKDGGATPGNLTRGWIARYLDNDRAAVRRIDGKTDPEGGAVENHPEPFRDQHGRVYLALDNFEHYVRHVVRVPTTGRDLSARLARLGFERVQLEGPKGDAKHGMRRWFLRSPDGFDPAEEQT